MAAAEHAQVYTIGVVARQTGLSPRRVRYYEEAGLIAPARSSLNQRLYSKADIARLLAARRLVDAGFTLDGVKALLDRPPADAAAASRVPHTP